MKKKTKHQKIKEHLESGKSITSWEAIELYNVTRLAAIIFNLKKDGHEIETQIIKKNKKRFAQYIYHRGPGLVYLSDEVITEEEHNKRYASETKIN